MCSVTSLICKITIRHFVSFSGLFVVDCDKFVNYRFNLGRSLSADLRNDR